jgi:AraC family transcriptional regulator
MLVNSGQRDRNTMQSEKTIARRVTVPGFEIREQHYVGGYRTTWHSHEEPEFCLVFGGHLTEDVLRGPQLLASPAVATFKPADVRHRVDVGGEAAGCIVVALSPDRLATDRSLQRAFSRPLLLNAARLRRICATIKTELGAADDFSPVALESLALEVVLLAARHRDRKGITGVPPWLLTVRDRLHDEVTTRYSLSELAITVGVKPTTLAQAFRRHFQRTIGEHVRELRIARAQELLRKGTLSIADVALSCGFYDQSHFTRTFHRAVGIAPGQYAAQFAARRKPAR